GQYPMIRAETDFSLVACAFDSRLVSTLKSEMEQPNGDLRLQTNIEDPAARQLMTLLTVDVNDRGRTDRLYTEYLTQALAVRMLFLGNQTKPSSNNTVTYGLPGHVLRRVIERMHMFDSDLSLQALANESGYSRVHFVRMFKAATGYSPHNYLLKLKL